MLLISGFEGALILWRTYLDLAQFKIGHRELRRLLEAELPRPGAKP
jgi:hypothetical protein